MDDNKHSSAHEDHKFYKCTCVQTSFPLGAMYNRGDNLRHNIDLVNT